MGNASPYLIRASRPVWSIRGSSKKNSSVKTAEFKFFNHLPADLKKVISGPLATKDASHLSCSSREMNALLQHQPAAPMRLRQFLHHVIRGEHIEMQTMLRANSNLLWQRGIVTDCSGREFGSVSGFEYALWALDKYQWDDMLACLPRDEGGHLTEQGQKVVEELLRQYEQIKIKGVKYRLKDRAITESHYDFSIIDALQKQVNAQNALGFKNQQAIDKQWRREVGGAQRLVPVHVVNEYCSTRSFAAIPKFDSRHSPANGLCQFYGLSYRWEPWFGAHSRVGTDFAIYKAERGWQRWAQAENCISMVVAEAVCLDLNAMKALWETRTQDFILLEAKLKSLLDVEERPRLGMS